jgi:proline iminopeptidase
LKPLEGVAEDRPVIFYDQLGAGRSDRPSDTRLWRTDRFVAELAQVRSHLGLDEVHILGHSWGSMLAMEYMLTEPAGIKSITFASPALNVKRWTDDAKTLQAGGTTDSPEYQEAVMEYYKLYLSRSDPWSPDLMAAFEAFNSELYGYMWGPSEFTANGILRDYNRESELAQLDVWCRTQRSRYSKTVLI